MPDALSGIQLKADAWLTEQLGRDVYNLPTFELLPFTVDQAAEAVTGLLAQVSRPALVYAKVPTDAVEPAQGLEEVGFRLVDTNITLERGRLTGRRRESRWTLRVARSGDQRQVVEMARRSFRYSRFHLDPKIDPKSADEIKAQWARNFFRGRRGDRLVLAESESVLAGFLLARIVQGNVMVVDLVATAEKLRGRGIAGDLTQYAQEQLPDAEQVRVGTQLANRPAILAYQSLGFSLARSAYVFHLHL